MCMTRRPMLFLTLLAAFPTFHGGCSNAASRQDSTTNVEGNDPEMGAAIAKARATLPEFWRKWERHRRDETDFSLKVRITDKNGTEHFWLSQLEQHDGKTFGVLNNDAQIVKCVKLGDLIEIPENEISDWLYLRRGKMVGNYTIRALFKKMSPEEVESCKKMLETP
jgi:uncharacterized protein YegJ (DUF2314 family)